MAARRSALGRGLGALIPDAPDSSSSSSGAAGESPTGSDAAPGSAAPAQAGTPQGARQGVGAIPVDRIRPNPQQPRRVFDDAELERLADSLRRHGVLQPVVVRAREDAPDRYELVVGERRWRAAKLAGLDAIPATVRDVAAPALLEVALVENVQRHDLNPIELALAFRELVDAGATQEAVGARVGMDRSSVANHLRLLELPRELQEDVERGTLGFGHAKAVLQLVNPERRRHLRDRVVKEGLSVRATEELARRLAGPSRKAASRRRGGGDAAEASVDPNLRDLAKRLEDTLQTRVRIRGSAAQGSLEIEFYGPEDLHRLARRLLEGPAPL